MINDYSPDSQRRIVLRTGLFVVMILCLVAASGTVAAASEATVDVDAVPSDPIQPGDSFTIDVSMTNTGDEAGTVIDIRIRDKPMNITADNPDLGLDGLEPGETTTKTITVDVGEDVDDGEYSVTAYGKADTEATDTTQVNFTVDSRLPMEADFQPDSITVGEPTDVTVTVTETDTDTPVTNARVTQLSSVETVSVNEIGEAQIQLSPTEAGNITLDITADGYIPITKNITVAEEAADLKTIDQDNDGEIDREDAVKAVVAYNTDDTIGNSKVSREAAVEAVIAYNTEQKLTSSPR